MMADVSAVIGTLGLGIKPTRLRSANMRSVTPFAIIQKETNSCNIHKPMSTSVPLEGGRVCSAAGRIVFSNNQKCQESFFEIVSEIIPKSQTHLKTRSVCFIFLVMKMRVRVVFDEKVGFGKVGFGRSKRLWRILCEKCLLFF